VKSRGWAAVVLGSLLLSGCGAGGHARSTAPSTSPVARTTSTDPTSSPTESLDPAHVVAAPGPFRAPLHTADMLIFRQRPLSASMVRRIRHVGGVTRVERLSLAQVSIDDHAINVAAVDPATFRNYNPETGPRFQQEWDRVAGGEMALRPRFRKQVPADGYVRMGTSATAPRVHVGAYAPQIPQVDAIVNDTWVKTLGMRRGNALIVSTGIHTPLSIRKPIQRIVGGKASVQRMDVAARLGLDPGTTQTAFLVGTAADAVGSFSYSVLGGGHIAPQQSWVASHISTETMPVIGPMTCNTLMFPQLRAALDEIVGRGLAGAIHPSQYGGCYVPRFIAGTTTLSNHAFGLAFDVNVPENQRGTVGQINRQVVQIFERWGFTWGGTWGYTDPMHFEMNRLVHPE
jgi:D-alanyl-D-alanine carboxypeptidase